MRLGIKNADAKSNDKKVRESLYVYIRAHRTLSMPACDLVSVDYFTSEKLFVTCCKILLHLMFEYKPATMIISLVLCDTTRPLDFSGSLSPPCRAS